MDAAEVAHRWVELYNDVEPGTYGSDRFLELYADDVRWREAPTTLLPQGRAGGLTALREAVAFGASVFVDRHVELKELMADHDHAAMRCTWSATTAVDLGPDAPPPGTRLTVELASFMRVADGKIVEITEIPSAPTQ